MIVNFPDAMNETSTAQPNEQCLPQDATATAQEAFRADLNHKLRTPLNAIIGFTQLLVAQPNLSGRKGDLQQILESAREMLKIIEHDLTEPGGKRPANEHGSDAQPTRLCDVLYVEDDAVNYALVARILEFRPEVKLMHAPRGLLGLELAVTQQPKLVLLDLNLPDMHGSDVLRRLQQEPATAHIPVVILSANATPSQIERLLTAGAKNYLTKPFDIDPFLTVVDEFVAVDAARPGAA